MKNISKISLLVIIMLGLSTTSSFSQVKLDLFNMTINNDTFLESLSIDKVTNILGRPSAVDRPPEFLADITGAKIFYHELGLSFNFTPKKDDQNEKLSSISIHLVRTWDSDFRKYFLPYPGVIDPDVNSNMKMNDLLTLFEGYEISIREAAEGRSELEQLGIDGSAIRHDALRVYIENYRINFMCEELTKFLERISIVF